MSALDILDIVFLIIIASISILGLSQGQDYLRIRYIRRHFRERCIRSLLVCENNRMKSEAEEILKRFAGYAPLEIVSLEAYSSNNEFIHKNYLSVTVQKSGVMKYPCILTLNGNTIKGSFIDLDGLAGPQAAM